MVVVVIGVVVTEVDGVDEVVVIEVAEAAEEVLEVCIRLLFLLDHPEDAFLLHWGLPFNVNRLLWIAV